MIKVVCLGVKNKENPRVLFMRCVSARAMKSDHYTTSTHISLKTDILSVCLYVYTVIIKKEMVACNLQHAKNMHLNAIRLCC